MIDSLDQSFLCSFLWGLLELGYGEIFGWCQRRFGLVADRNVWKRQIIMTICCSYGILVLCWFVDIPGMGIPAE